MEQRYFDFPFHINSQGRSATTGEDDHVRDLIAQVLFTSPGERVNRPDFGCGLKALLFLPNGDALATATEVLVKSALQKWLAEEIVVDRVAVQAEESQLKVIVTYRRRVTGERRVDEFAVPGARP